MAAETQVEPPRRIRLLDVEPDMGALLAPGQEGVAADRSVVSAFSVGRGRWSLGGEGPASAPPNLYVVSGTLAGRVSVGGRSSVELLGPGDLICPQADVGEETLCAEGSWRALEPAWLAVLDDDFWVRMSAWPELVSAFLRRAFRRARSLSLLLAISQCPGLVERLYLVLWHLADRHGYVQSSGVVLPLRLSHAVLAELVSASRPSVSRPLRRLEEEGFVARCRNGSFVLRGRAPAQLTDATAGRLFDREC